ncbi:hypothetical protein C3Y89_24300 [Rhizobium sp. UPM1132]|uniref:hypothetical protein n=1 Tax=Rhizobium ruizarguesonis TaxID=2081791 RepID=UPI00144751E0|nr:hypothetical protein [Rhizobium ruizarguesonis]NKQ73427.1 hypothetical protein [Rhizobium ruizarguesonis]
MLASLWLYLVVAAITTTAKKAELADMVEQTLRPGRGLRSWYRRLSRFSQVMTAVATAIGVAGFVVAVIEFTFGTSIFYNPSAEYRKKLDTVAGPILSASYSLLAEPGVTDNLKKIPGVSERLAAMQAIYTKHVADMHLEGSLEQTVDTYDAIARCHRSWVCHIDDYPAFRDDMINVWFSYGEKIRQMRVSAAGSDFGVPLEKEAKRLRAEQKAEVG